MATCAIAPPQYLPISPSQSREFQFRGALVGTEARLINSVRKQLDVCDFDTAVFHCGHDAWSSFARNRFQLVVIDCTAEGQWLEFLTKLRSSARCRACIVIALVSDSQSASEAFRAGANFVLNRTGRVELIQRCIRVAQPAIQKDLDRYKRHSVELRCTILSSGKRIEGTIVNISRGGCGVSLHSSTVTSGSVEITMHLPRVTSPIQFKSKVAWVSAGLRLGLEFEQTNIRSLALLHSWLEHKGDPLDERG
jgi:DNA-binding response OmpR family regulator